MMYGENEVEPYGNKIDYIPRDNKFEGFNIPNEDIVDPGAGYKEMNLDWDTIPENQKKEGGTISKKKFTKNLLAFYEEGGENPNDPNAIGKGNRQDNAAREVGKMIPNFIDILKTDSNESITGDIYELAKGDPEIMQTLMTNGKQENLAEPTESNPNEMEYAQEGRELQNNGNQMEEIIGQVQGALESGAQPEEVMMQLLQGGLEPEAVAQIFVQLGMPEEQVVQVIQQVMAQGQQQPQGQPQGMGPSEEEMMAMQQQQQQMGPPPMMQVGGFADMVWNQNIMIHMTCLKHMRDIKYSSVLKVKNGVKTMVDVLLVHIKILIILKGHLQEQGYCQDYFQDLVKKISLRKCQIL